MIIVERIMITTVIDVGYLCILFFGDRFSCVA
jgi:hypothetical protein